MKNFITCISKVICLIILICISYSAGSQTLSPAPAFNLYISNAKFTDGKTLEFDLFLVNLNKTETFELASVQAGILVNPELYNNGTIKASLVEGSSELLELQKPASVLFTQPSNIIKLAGRIIRPTAKSAQPTTRGTIISSTQPGTRICRIRLTNSADFAKAPVKLDFCFDRTLYSTIVAEYISGINTPLPCNKTNCFSKLTK